MSRVTDCYKMYNVIIEVNERHPLVGDKIKVDEWDETGTTISHDINIKEIIEIRPYQIMGGNWQFEYIIKST